jgi:hypothetical protein
VALPLDDPALLMALMLAVRGGRVIISADAMPAARVRDANRRPGRDAQRR